MVTRREVLGWMGGGVALTTGLPRLAVAGAETDRRLVVILLRGGMDGLSAVPAIGDPDFVDARAGMGDAILAGGPLRLDAMFALHPNLRGFESLYRQGELTVVHAMATPYRDRSHFDGQNLLESGGEKPYGMESGWLNRALVAMPGPGKRGGVALNSHMPLMLRGATPVSSWSPSLLAPPQSDTVERLASLYADTDPSLAQAFAAAQGANATARGSGVAGQPFITLVNAAARLLSGPNGARIAMAETGGWDTHVNQSGAFSPLSTNLSTLDRGVTTLKIALGAAWRETAVLIVSEFGRTVAQNGTGGTDHGVGGAMFLAGGAVKGGRVIADWPGLKSADLYERRDLMATIDFRAVALGVLRDHLKIDEGRLASIFPSQARIRPLEGLVRA